ncbi:hypothetical protein K788_0000421 [Paraburkholderia caribensis MBA4]|uniref:Uncharacterized protein n=2 Tax=Paraburkholderia caribensis TaxID=75105 RepID=A0A0P0RIG7_9BURK|nr:hypothetical protein K788_0000421 [Paraburkholderia caribensis MBA4]
MDQIASGATAAQLARLYHAFTELDEQGYLLGGENGGAELAAPVKRDGFVVGAISCVIAGATATGSGQLLRRAARTVAESMFPQN